MSRPGALLPWTADVDDIGRGIGVSPDGSKVAIGGDFFSVNGAYSHSIAIVDAVTGANIRTYPAGFIANTSVTKHIFSADDGRFYISNEGTGGGVFDGRAAFSWATGDQLWRDTSLGATQMTLQYQTTLYSVSHGHNCDSVNAQSQDGTRHYFLAQSAVDGSTLRVGSQVQRRHRRGHRPACARHRDRQIDRTAVHVERR